MSNKVIISKFGKVKVTIAGGLFLLDILEPNFYLNIASMNKICESNCGTLIFVILILTPLLEYLDLS